MYLGFFHLQCNYHFSRHASTFFFSYFNIWCFCFGEKRLIYIWFRKHDNIGLQLFLYFYKAISIELPNQFVIKM